MKKIEGEIAQLFARLRKEWVGRGAIDTQVRVCADTIFIRYRATYTPFERALMSQLGSNYPNVVNPEACGDLFTQAERLIKEVFPDQDLKVLKSYAMIDPDMECQHSVVVLDKNIERICQQRVAARDALPDGRANHSGVAQHPKR